MKRLLTACALSGLCVLGCGGAADTARGNANGPANATASTSPLTQPSAAPTAQLTQSADATKAGAQEKGAQAQHDITGPYTPLGELPAEFAELDHLLLATIDENSKPAPLNGFLRPKRQSAKDYTLVGPKLEGKNLTFKTIEVGGTSYAFTGAFEKLADFAADPPPQDEAVLTGTLTKMSGGKAVAETKVSFAYTPGG